MGTEMLSMPSRFLREIPVATLITPIRWGTEIYQAGEGVRPGSSFARGAGGASVATELQRIRSFFDRVKEASASIERMPHGGRLSETCRDQGSKCISGRNPREERAFRRRAPCWRPQGSGDGLTYTVRFDQSGDKRIMARFGGLERA